MYVRTPKNSLSLLFATSYEDLHAQMANNGPVAHCDNYLCPDTLACVHFPHHCPCAWDLQEDKFELGEGKRLCASKGGLAQSETARKVELARKGLL
jgi:hypothetical protein